MSEKWISVDEGLPDPEVDVLVAAAITPNKSVTIADIGITGEWSIEDKVRYWMPLPVAPWHTEERKGIATTKRVTISGIDGRADHGPDCKVDALGENCNCGIIPLKPQSSVPAPAAAIRKVMNGDWVFNAAKEISGQDLGIGVICNIIQKHYDVDHVAAHPISLDDVKYVPGVECPVTPQAMTGDGWLLCPKCGLNELYSLDIPPTRETIVGCYNCDWKPAERPVTPQAEPGAAGLSDEEIARKCAELVMSKCVGKYQTTDSLVAQAAKFIAAAIAEVRQWDGERHKAVIREYEALQQRTEARADSLAATLEKLIPCQSPDHELCDNQGGHPRTCHCLDPLFWKKRADSLAATLEKVREIASPAGHAPCRSGGMDAKGVCPNTCFCEWAVEINSTLASLSPAPGTEATDAGTR